MEGISVRENGTIAVNDHFQAGNAKYFAAGDCVNGGKEVVDAVAEGMAAARGIDAWLATAAREALTVRARPRIMGRAHGQFWKNSSNLGNQSRAPP